MLITAEVNVRGGAIASATSQTIVGEELSAAMHASTQHIRGLIIPASPVFQGTLRQGTQATVSTTGTAMDITGRVFNPVAHGVPVELGRRPGKKQPPSSALELWVRRKLGVPENRVKSVAFLVARKIGQKGTKAVLMFQKSLAAATPTVNRFFDRAVARIVQRLG